MKDRFAAHFTLSLSDDLKSGSVLQFLDGTLVSVLRVKRLVGGSAMYEHSESQAEGLAGFDFDAAEFSASEGLSAERVRRDKAIISCVKPTRSEVRGIGHQHETDSLTIHFAAIVAPVGGLPPDVFLVALSTAVEDFSLAIFYGERRGDADAQSHFFLVSEGEWPLAGEGRFVSQHPASGMT